MYVVLLAHGRNFKFDEIANVQAGNTIVTTTNNEKEVKAVAGSVATIQSNLNYKYNFNLAVDNIYGPETKKALVKTLQTELNKQYNKGLAVDGCFGNLTKNACVSVRKGSKGNITWILQAMLVCKGYNISIDADFGSNTENAVKDYQNRNGLIVDGIARKKYFC